MGRKIIGIVGDANLKDNKEKDAEKDKYIFHTTGRNHNYGKQD